MVKPTPNPTWKRKSGMFSIPLTPRPEKDRAPVKMQVFAYGPRQFEEKDIQSPSEVKKFLRDFPVTWLNVDGTAERETIEEIGKLFHLHALGVEDVLNVQEQAKVETYGQQLFVVVRMVMPDTDLDTEQVSMFIGNNFLVTFQEKPGGDCLNPVRMRIRRYFDDIQEKSAAYLAYTILDTIVDAYFPVLERYGERLEAIEDRIAHNPHRSTILQIHDIKRDLLVLRRAIWPLRDAIHDLQHDSVLFGSEELRFYLRDLYDHTMRVIEFIEVGRELCSDLMDFYLSSVGNRTNEVMKFLTLVSTIFMSLTFITSIYSISAINSPAGSGWGYSYPFVMISVGILSVLMLVYFRWREWI